MSFQPPIKGAAEGLPQSSIAELRADPAAAPSDPAKAHRYSEDARKKTLRTLNAIKIMSPIMAAVVERHGVNGTEEDSVGMFKSLVGQASDMSELVMRELGEDASAPGNFWLRNVLERAFCEILKDQVQRGRDVSLRPLEPVLMGLAKMDLHEPEGAQQFENWAPDTAVRAALLRAAAPIMIKAAGFDFFRSDMERDMEQIMRLLMASASRGLSAMVDPGAGDKERASLFSVLIGEAGALYASAWHACGKQMVANLSSLGDKQLASLLAENPDGLSLAKVNETFEKNFSRLVSLSSKLVPQKAGKIESRIKTAKAKAT